MSVLRHINSRATLAEPKPDGWPFQAANIAPPPESKANPIGDNLAVSREGDCLVVRGAGEVRLNPETARAIAHLFLAIADMIDRERESAANPGRTDATEDGSTE
jgi:hypothetical protein